MSNLLTRKEIDQRVKDKKHSILQFLRDERFTDVEVISKLIDVGHLTSVRNTLKAMQKEDLVVSHKVGRKVVWGVTIHGVMMSYQDGETIPENVYAFRPSKFNELTFEHKKAMQLCRIAALKNGWCDWVLARIEKGVKVPDAIALNSEGERVAVEYERTVKTPKRYTAIFISHLESIKARRYKKVTYICPTEAVRKRVESQFLRLVDKPVQITGGVVTVNSELMNQIFSFKLLESFTNED
ncbi:putative mobilization protein mobC [Photobacterium marinum]|uniref:Putative mobilization protein mobC n=1 Tax=Photobacterium marinum TaxID=1056511 RepID=L8JA31_9GAMM|nr:hypothetical protein [Photobacterium marinum]ELR64404.1 putative mobilization protein mobC [Photobacterium marinum]